jgi:hypothetical protein
MFYVYQRSEQILSDTTSYRRKTPGCVVKTPEDDVKGMNRNWILQSYAISPFRSPLLYNLYDEPEAFENGQKRDE